jgi:glycosyltransferase involved in cell wall biosynthesis
MNQKRPLLVAIVGNDILIDNRVKKAASTAVAAGYETTLICFTASATRVDTMLGETTVIKLPIPFLARKAGERLTQPLRPFVSTELLERHQGPRSRLQARLRRLQSQRGVFKGSLREATFLEIRLTVLRLWIRLRRDAFRLRRKLHLSFDNALKYYFRSKRRLNRILRPRYSDPARSLMDYNLVFGPMIEELKPDIIHAHDFHMIGVAVDAARHLRSSGHHTKVLYDAHELVRGLSYPASTIKIWANEEALFIKEVDGVVGVSPVQIDELQSTYGLSTRPTLVLNAPFKAITEEPPNHLEALRTVRDDAGCTGPLLVYHGNIALDRGINTLVESLSLLNSDIHVAIIAPKEGDYKKTLQELVVKLELQNRVHFLPFVAPEKLTSYLSTGDLAVIPYLKTGNNDVALPNKLFESLQAGLPIVASDMAALSSFISEYGVGISFSHGSPKSLAYAVESALLGIEELRSNLTDELLHLTTWEAQGERLTSLYHSLVPANASSRIATSSSALTETLSISNESCSAPLTRLAIGPRNMAGQAFLIATAVQTHFNIPTVSFALEKSIFGFPSHYPISNEQWSSPFWQQSQQELLSSKFTHVLTESGTGIFGALNGGFIDEQMDALTQSGLKAAILFHGSEIRDPRRHRELPYSPYTVRDDLIKSLETATSRLRQHLTALDLPFFVTTPDLLEDIPATWLPVVVDVKLWEGLAPRPAKSIPTVFHLPSNNRLKGSAFVDKTLSKLQEEGLVHYLRPDSLVPASAVPILIQQSDIVIDGIVLGAYGVMSCQSMAAGRITIANTRDISPTIENCPIVHADPDSLEEVIKQLLINQDKWEEIGYAGQGYVRKFHNGTATADCLSTFLES